MKRIRPSLSYADIISTLCLFLLLGGGVAVASGQLAKNSVGTRQLRRNAVTAAKIKDKAVTGAKLDLSTIGTVPSAAVAGKASQADNAAHADSATRADNATQATNAGNAETVGGQTAAQIVAQGKLACPAGTTLVSGSCFDAVQRPGANFREALETCAKANMVLPAPGEIATFMMLHPGDQTNWTSSAYLNGGSFQATFILASGGGVSTGAGAMTGSFPFRCVTQPTN